MCCNDELEHVGVQDGTASEGKTDERQDSLRLCRKTSPLAGQVCGTWKRTSPGDMAISVPSEVIIDLRRPRLSLSVCLGSFAARAFSIKCAATCATDTHQLTQQHDNQLQMCMTPS